MNNYNNFLKQIEFAKHYSDWFLDHLGNDVELFNEIIKLGFENFHSYYSVLTHERYLYKINGELIFIFRNGNSDYYAEFSDNNMAFSFFKIVQKEFITYRMEDSNTVRFPCSIKFFNEITGLS